MDSHIARLFSHRRPVLLFSGLVGVYGFIMSFLVATSIGLNSYTLQELDSIERLQELLRGMVAVGAIVGAGAALVAIIHPPAAVALFIIGGIIAAIGLGLVGSGWALVAGPRVEYFLGPVPVVHWATAGLLARPNFSSLLTFPMRWGRNSAGSQGARSQADAQNDSEVSS